MHERHKAVYSSLTNQEVDYLSKSLITKGFIPEPPATTDDLVNKLDPYSHADVVLTLANDPSEIGITIIEKLIARPIYMCARGETSETLTDMRGNPLKTPLGHRRHEPPFFPERLAVPISDHIRGVPRKIDNRIITAVIPNPKTPGSRAWARYNEYVVGKSVSWHLLNTAVIRPDINWDAKQGYITLVSPVHMQKDKADV